MAKVTDAWTKNHYLSYIAIYGANIDAEMTDDELRFIRDHFGETAFSEASALFKTHSDYEAIQTISNLRGQFFPGENGKEEIVADLEAVFASDKRFSEFEHAVLNAISRVL